MNNDKFQYRLYVQRKKCRRMTFYYCQSPTLFISPMPSLSAVSALSNRFVFHTDYYALCRVLSCAPTAPALPPGNPALSSYIPRSDCGLYYCFLLSAPTGTPSLSDFALPYLFRKACAEVGVYRVFVPVRSGPVDCLRPWASIM